MIAAITALVLASNAQAGVVKFRMMGQLTGIQYDYVNGVLTFGSGGPASTALLAIAPIGSRYTFTYSYDTSALPTTAYPGGAFFQDLAIGGNIALAGANLALPRANAYVGSNGLGQRYSISGNFPFGSPAALGGFRGIDFSFDLSRLTPGAPLGSTLPVNVNLADFPNQYARIRFVKNGVGETGVLFYIDSITSTTGVPEPAIWTMMLIGFGAAAAGLRAGRHATRARTISLPA